ncbi:hypothetical protein [Nocardia farcinica]|uniref:Uncharacterized protein n=1 Tax=Nocardia farcinica (strain IFM 10152) TaxID=247156 RepID=Q5YTB6_NOCFA|nr:hypothetical protein [Nocardia farcinica]BAD58575.1 hypothetical protein NFA_37270 [Nocardia farcinica IFM 10152]
MSAVLRRLNDTLVAPDASAGERLLGYGAASAGALVAVLAGVGAGWSILTVLVLGVVAFDLFGGATVNAMDAAKRWWHRPGQGPGRHLVFVAVHVQPFLVAWVVPGFGWITAAGLYLATLVAAGIVLATPLPYRRPVGFTVTTLTLAVVLAAAAVPAAVAWFVPVLLIKLLLAHLQPEGAADCAERNAGDR